MRAVDAGRWGALRGRHSVAAWRDAGERRSRTRQGFGALGARRPCVPPPDARGRTDGSGYSRRCHHCPRDRRNAGAAGLRPQLPGRGALESRHRTIRCAGADLWHARHLVRRDADRCSDRAVDCGVSHRIVSALLAPADRHRDRAVGRHSQHHLWHLGLVRVRAVPAGDAPAVPDRPVRQCPAALRAVRRPSVRDRHADRRSHPRHHGAAVHHVDLARRLRRGAAGAQGSGVRRGLHHLGGGMVRGGALCTGRGDRRRDARARACARRDHGGHLRHRQCSQNIRIHSRARYDHLGHHCQRIHRSRWRPLHVLADRARSDPVRHHVHRAGDRALHAAADRTADRSLTMVPNASLYARRRRRNAITMVLSTAATAFGLGWLVLILAVLVWEVFIGLYHKASTEMTPPPGADGGLLNPIVGSLILTVLAVLIGTPIGILAGTYMAEYGRYDRLTSIVRFINDILLSAPSIVVGLFIYEIMVAPMGHFSGLAGAVALAVIVIPVVVRTTEDMLLLVPNPLREAAAAMGMPRAVVVTRIAYRAAKAGILTGVLLAVARISGETAPLLFTALNNQFWSLNLNAPVASLPAVIFQFALSPYADWQALAWTGALIITMTVLALSITARALSGQRKNS